MTKSSRTGEYKKSAKLDVECRKPLSIIKECFAAVVSLIAMFVLYECAFVLHKESRFNGLVEIILLSILFFIQCLRIYSVVGNRDIVKMKSTQVEK